MRKRDEIEKDQVRRQNGYTVDEQAVVLALEVLLDIRDLLVEANRIEINGIPSA